jgi:hypothetical protein
MSLSGLLLTFFVPLTHTNGKYNKKDVNYKSKDLDCSFNIFEFVSH